MLKKILQTLLAVFSLSGSLPIAQAQVSVWDGDTSTGLQINTNWVGNVLPPNTTSPSNSTPSRQTYRLNKQIGGTLRLGSATTFAALTFVEGTTFYLNGFNSARSNTSGVSSNSRKLTRTNGMIFLWATACRFGGLDGDGIFFAFPLVDAAFLEAIDEVATSTSSPSKPSSKALSANIDSSQTGRHADNFCAWFGRLGAGGIDDGACDSRIICHPREVGIQALRRSARRIEKNLKKTCARTNLHFIYVMYRIFSASLTA